MHQPNMGRALTGNAFDQKRGSASAAAASKQHQAKSATGGPDHFDDKSGSRMPSHDDLTSKNSGVQKQSGNSRSRQSRQSRQSAAKDRKAHLTERIKGAAGTGASSSLNGNFAKEKRRVLPHTDSMMKVGPGLPQRNGEDQKAHAIGPPNNNEYGPFKMNQFQLEDTPPHDDSAQRPQAGYINSSVGQGGFGTVEARGKVLKSEFERHGGDLQQVNSNSVVHDPTNNVNDLQIDPNPFARRDKSRQSNQRTGRERRPRMRSGVYDDTSSNPVSKTPSLPNADAMQPTEESYHKPTFQVEENEHNITNISLNVSHMNLTAEAEVIEELDEETFRPSNRNHEETQKQAQSHSFVGK